MGSCVDHVYMELRQAQEIVRTLFTSQAFGVLATQEDTQPYTTLVAFAPTEDQQHILFVTERSTTKYTHITQNPQVALLIDNRSNHPRDFSQAAVATLLGNVTEVPEEQHTEYLNQYLAKHPHLTDFVRAPSSALLLLQVHKIILVTRFQHVIEWEINEHPDTSD